MAGTHVSMAAKIIPHQQHPGHHRATARLTHHSTVEEFLEAVFYVWFISRLYKNQQYKSVASQQGHEHGTRAISIVRNHYKATTGEGIEDFVFAVVICSVCRSVKVVASYKCSVNPIISPNPVSSH
jgi:hypothetical protein